jgi:hypothetical protein
MDALRSGDYRQSTYVQPLLRIPEKQSGQSKTGEYTPVDRSMGNKIERERYCSGGTRETYAIDTYNPETKFLKKKESLRYRLGGPSQIPRKG